MEILINIDVADLTKATDFYGRAFGLHVGRRLGEGALELIGGSSKIYLLSKPAGTAAARLSAQRRHYERHWTPVHLDFVVDDIEGAMQKAIAAGAQREGEIETQAWGKLALLADPFGNGFCLIEFVGQGYDEIASS